jgi:hypothetical protein
VKTPYHRVKQQHVEADRNIYRPIGQAAARRPDQAEDAGGEINPDCKGGERYFTGVGFGRDGIENAPYRDDENLDQLDEDFTAIFLLHYRGGNTARQFVSRCIAHQFDHAAP